MSAAQGRFLSADPFNAGADPANPQSWNAYGYVNGNPLNATDPSGMDPFIPGDPGDPGLCWDDPFCGGGDWPIFPLPIWDQAPSSSTPPPPTSSTPAIIQNTTGVYAQGQWGSFPNDGEALGMPVGMKIPGPLSAQVLLGLGATWDCSSELCLPNVLSRFDQLGGIPTSNNAASIYRQQLVQYLRALTLSRLCPRGGTGSMVVKQVRNSAITGAIRGAAEGAGAGALGGEIVGAIPGALAGGAVGAMNGVPIGLARAGVCHVFGAPGF